MFLSVLILFLGWSFASIGVGTVVASGCPLAFWLWVFSRPVRGAEHASYRGEWIPDFKVKTKWTRYERGQKIESEEEYFTPAHRKMYNWHEVRHWLREYLCLFTLGTLLAAVTITSLWMWGDWPSTGMAIIFLPLGLMLAIICALFSILYDEGGEILHGPALGGALMVLLGIGIIVVRTIHSIILLFPS